MKKNLKFLLLILLVVTFGIGLLACDQIGETNGDNTFTVEFADYDGTVLKSIICPVGEPCVITPPVAPNNKENCRFTRWSVWAEDFDQIDSNTTIKAIYTLDNRLITIGGRSIVFYAVLIMTGILLAFYLGIREAKRTGVNVDQLTDGFLWIVPVSILGARLWYVAFEFEAFVDSRGFFNTLLRILGFANGNLNFSEFGLAGLAIHGAFFTAFVCVLLYTKKKKVNLLKLLDLMAVGFLCAQTFGRWGNFLNQEAHGGLIAGETLKEQWEFLRYTLHIPEFIANNMYIFANGTSVAPVTGFYHPTFLYELTLNWLGFFIAIVLRRLKGVKIGEMLSFYLIWYGGVRIFIESMRTDPLTYNIFGLVLKAATTTSVLMILGGIALSLCIRFWWKGESYGSIPGHFEFKKKKAVPADEKA